MIDCVASDHKCRIWVIERNDLQRSLKSIQLAVNIAEGKNCAQGYSTSMTSSVVSASATRPS